MSLRRILVAIKDTSARLPPAVVKAAQLATASRASIELFHAIDAPLYVDVVAAGGDGISRFKRDLLDLHQRRLTKLASRIRSPGMKVTVRVEWDFPSYEAIIRRALRMRADLVVAERHAHRHVLPRLLHIAESVCAPKP
jgi:nucleotide-binding universal stress UspA family protein